MSERELTSKIASIDGEIQELVHESKLPALNKLLDESSGLYLERIAELELQQADLLYAILSIEHERGGSLGANGQFYYKVPERIFKKAKALKEQGK